MTATVKIEKATVASGRSLRDSARKVWRAGQEVELPVDEVKRLRERGFLVDPKAKQPVGKGLPPRHPVVHRGA